MPTGLHLAGVLPSLDERGRPHLSMHPLRPAMRTFARPAVAVFGHPISMTISVAASDWNSTGVLR
jgi:hypothetical protein